MISAVILTKNEENNIADCMESLAFCDEIIVVDSDSTDRTEAIAKKMGAMVYTRSLDNNFSNLRNFGLSKATHEWVFFVDADERVSSSLRDEIKEATQRQNNPYQGFRLLRSDIMWGKELLYGETRNLKLLRLAKKEKGRWMGRAHETWRIDGQVGDLENRLLHYPHPELAEFLEEINVYTDLRAQELYEKGARVYWWSIILYPKAKFFVNYFLKRGILDGLPGLVFAIMMSFHSFLVRGKLWFLWKKS